MNRFKFRSQKHKESGIALIIVLSMMAVMMLIVFGMWSESTVSELSGRTLSARGKMKYEAESHISRSLWSYLWDRKKYSSWHRQLGREVEERPEEDGRPWLADGSQYIFNNNQNNTNVIIKIHDAMSGTNIDSVNRPGMDMRKQRYIQEMEDEELLERIERFTYALDDYIDTNEYYSHPDYHYEMEDYENDGVADFPANNRMQVKEEVYWLDHVDVKAQNDVGKLVKSAFRVIAPRTWSKGPSRTNKSVISSNRGTKSSLFSTASSSIQQEQDLDEEQMQELNDLKNGKILWDEVSPETQSALNKYSRDESGICTIEATGLMYNGEISRTIKVTFDCDTILKNRYFFNCWEQIIY